MNKMAHGNLPSQESQDFIKVYLIKHAHTLYKLNAISSASIITKTKIYVQKALIQICQTSDVKAIVDAERSIVSTELVFDSNSMSRLTSLHAALTDFDIIDRHIAMVMNPASYKVSEEFFCRPKNIKNGLPYDTARQAFAAHIKRLDNADKAFLSESLQEVLSSRISAFRAASNIYIKLQANALGYIQEGKSFKPIIPSWVPEMQRRSAQLERLQANSAGALLTFANLGVTAIEQAGSFEKVDWQSVEDLAMSQSIGQHNQNPVLVFDALSSYSPGSVTKENKMLLRDRIVKVARSQNLDKHLVSDSSSDLDM